MDNNSPSPSISIKPKDSTIDSKFGVVVTTPNYLQFFSDVPSYYQFLKDPKNYKDLLLGTVNIGNLIRNSLSNPEFKQFVRDIVSDIEIPSIDTDTIVTIEGEQEVKGRKDFTGGLAVNGQNLIYDPVKKVWQLTGDLVVTGAVTMFGSLSGFTPSTVTEAVEVDGSTIIKTKNSQGQWQLTAIGGGSGSGGGISAAEVNILIENALKPYIKIETADDKYALISTVSGINSRLSAVETFFATEDSDTLINKWSEIVAFLNATEGDTLDNILATKANQSALDAAVASLTAEIGKKWTQNDTKISNWDSAYGWGNHANAGYAAKTYVDTELAKYVKLATAQKIDAQHNFVNGLQIGGLPITKSASANNTIYLDANLVVSGAITMFGSGSTTFPTIWANIPFNLEHMSWDGSQWNIKGGGGSGSLDTNAVNVLIYDYLTKNSYVTQRWVGDNATKYLGAASVDSARHAIGYDNLSMGSTNLPLAGGFISADQGSYGFQLLGSIQGNRLFVRSLYDGSVGTWSEIASQLWVGDNYLSKSGGTIEGELELSSTNAARSIRFATSVGSSWLFVNSGEWYVTNIGWGAEYKLIHSGNIGSYNAGSANVLKKSFANENINYGAGDGLKLIYCHSNPGNFASDWQSGISVLTDYTGWQLTCYGGVNIPNPYFRQRDDAGIWRDWHQLAFLTDNVASATKLQTPRTIWGQSFDGEADVGGNLTIGYYAIYLVDGNESYKIGWNSKSELEYTSYYGHIFNAGNIEVLRIDSNGNVAIGGAFTPIAKFHVAGTGLVTEHFSVGANLAHANIDRAELSIVSHGDSPTDLMFGYSGTRKWSISSRSATSTVAKSIGLYNYEADAWAWVVDVNNNVAIGGSTADAKLHVYGDIITTGNIEGGIFGLRNSSPDNPLLRLTVGNQNYYVQATSDGIYLGPTSTLSLKVDTNGNTTINGNLLATGVITMFSQASMKNVIDYDGLSLAQLAQIRPARFTWKDGRDTLVHAGGIADEVRQVLPEVVYKTSDDKLTMDYGSAGFFMAASLIKPVIDHEQRLQSAEKEIKDLRAENKLLREQLRAS